MSWSYRPARMTDVFPIVEILAERQKDSRYAGICPVDQAYARKLVANRIGRNGGTHDGAAFVEVAVSDGRIEAFVMGSLGRVYSIGEKLCATDNFLIGRRGCPISVQRRLFRDYAEWAGSIPDVIEIGASHNDVIEGSDHFDKLFRGEGFVPCGAIYRRSVVPAALEMAA